MDLIPRYSPTALIELDQVTLPALGRNAGSGTLLSARNDEEAVAIWLRGNGKRSPATMRNYFREAERLLLWLKAQPGPEGGHLTLRDMRVEHVQAFEAWLRDPQPRAKWCLAADASIDPATLKRPARFLSDRKTPNLAWRPFIAPPSPATADLAMRIIGSLFHFLAACTYLAANPMLRELTGGHSKPAPALVEHVLEPDVVEEVLGYIDRLPRDTPRQQAHYARNKFLVIWYYLLGLRISEAAAGRTCDIRRVRGQYWLHVHGKGDKDADIPLVADALEALKAYRVSTGRDPMPSPEKIEPIVMDICGKGRPLTTQGLHKVMSELFEAAADQALDAHIRQTLRQASSHWWRHTCATAQLDAGVPLLVVRDNLRHSSVKTTERYLHVQAEAQHKATEAHRIHRPGGK